MTHTPGSKFRDLHRPGDPASGDDRQSPAEERVHPRGHRRRDDDAGHDRGRRGDGVQQIVEPRHVVGQKLQHGRDAQRQERRVVAEPLEARRQSQDVGARRQPQGEKRHEDPEAAGGRQSQPHGHAQHLAHGVSSGLRSSSCRIPAT